MAVEHERKYDVDEDFTLPDLSGVLPAGASLARLPLVSLRATYHDTDTLRLARSGLSLRHRIGDPRPWTVKLPTRTTGVRREISRAGGAGAIPAELASLVRVYTRDAALAPVTTLATARERYEVRDADGTALAEIDDDRVDVLDGPGGGQRFREVEVELHEGDPVLLDRIGEALERAGARGGQFVPKHIRSLGPAAHAAPDLAGPPEAVTPATGGEAVTRVLRHDIARILTNDPLLRLRATTDDGDTPVHQMRVGCRRLRSDLRTFAPLLDPAFARLLRTEAGWLAGLLGAARDAEVLQKRLRRTAGGEAMAVPMDPAALAHLDLALRQRQDAALRDLDEALAGERYLRLVEMLYDAAAVPRLSARAGEPVEKLMPKLVAGNWRRLRREVEASGDHSALSGSDADARWHQVRIRAKRVRYAAEAATEVIGKPAARLASRLKAVQDLLGEQQDAVVAGNTWLGAAAQRPRDARLALTAGRLYERERAAARAARVDFPAAWRRVRRRKATKWLAR
jgi:CHAD domain-containing protein